MNTYWVADSYESMNELELVYIFTSVKLWKKYHPHHKTVLYTDKISWETLGWDNLWDEVIFYDFTTPIVKKSNGFWAAGKLQVMKEFETPFSILDLDLVYNGQVNFNKDIIAAYKELGYGYYLRPNAEQFKKADIKPFSKTANALNVSFLHIKDKSFRDEYVDIAIDWMETFSRKDVVEGALMIYCEQKLLLDLIERDSIPYRTLISEEFRCAKHDWVNDMESWSIEDRKYYHLKNDKDVAKRDETFMLVQKGKMLELLNSINDEELVRECFYYLRSKRDE